MHDDDDGGMSALWAGAGEAGDSELPALDALTGRITEIVNAACAAAEISPELECDLLHLHYGAIEDPYYAQRLCDRVLGSVSLRRCYGELMKLADEIEDIPPAKLEDVPASLWAALDRLR